MVSCSPLSICSYMFINMFVNMFVMIVWLVYIIGVDSLETRSSCVWPKDFLSLCIAIRQGGSFIKLCTNTIYSPDPSSLNSLMHQCEVRRSDILIQCGDNGNVEDNCIIDGGKTPIVVPNDDGPLKGVRFHGITFRNASNSLSTLMIENGNEVIFDNCIWQVCTFIIVFTLICAILVVSYLKFIIGKYFARQRYRDDQWWKGNFF